MEWAKGKKEGEREEKRERGGRKREGERGEGKIDG